MAMNLDHIETSVNNLVINKVPSMAVFEEMRAQSQIQENQIYLIQEAPPALTIGNYTYNGTTAVNVPVYNGSYTWTNN